MLLVFSKFPLFFNLFFFFFYCFFFFFFSPTDVPFCALHVTPTKIHSYALNASTLLDKAIELSGKKC